MIFPSDHKWHRIPGTIEWIYASGRLSNGKFFHMAEFFVGRDSHVMSRHLSIDGEFLEEVDESGSHPRSFFIGESFLFSQGPLTLNFNTKNVPMLEHKLIDGRNYYSIPKIDGWGYLGEEGISTTAWIDHEWQDLSLLGREWEWMGINLDNGESFVSYVGDNIDKTDDRLNGLSIEPECEEKIFYPKFGFPYSEQPIQVFRDGLKVGSGVRERAYKEASNG